MPDVIVLGGGPAGYSCALRLSDHGMTVALVEASEVGGTCLHRGCVPTRAMLEAATVADAVTTKAPRWGIEAVLEKIDFTHLLATRDEIVARNHKALRRHLEKAGVELVVGWGRLQGPRSIEVDGGIVPCTRAMVIATGSTPRTFPRIPADGVRVLTSDDALRLDRVPSSALILGGGAIGAEFAQVWRAFGAEVTILEREPRLIPFEDEDAGVALGRALKRRGIESITDMHVEHAAASMDGVVVDITRNGTTETREAEVLLLAAGRTPTTAGIGLEAAGVTVDDGYVVVDDSFETTAEGVYAVGDALGPPSLGRANAAFAEGVAVADTIAGHPSGPLDYRMMPRITHGIIESACVGWSEQDATSAGLGPRSMTLPMAAVAKGAIVGEPGLAKVVVDRDGIEIGVHLVGPNASELIGEAVATTNFEASAEEASSLVHPHPVLSESLQELHMALAGRPLHLR